MKVISLHSHKGGCGKTTMTLLLATIYARRGKKVCVLDLDLPAPSLHTFARIPAPRRYINDFFSDVSGRVERQKMMGEFISSIQKVEKLDITFYRHGRGRVLRDVPSIQKEEKLEIAFYLADPGREAIRKSSENLTLDLETDLMKDRLLEILEYLKKEKYDYCLLDSHPGIYSISSTILTEVNRKGPVILMSTLDRSHLEGTVRIASDLQGGSSKISKSRIFLCVNRLDKAAFEKYSLQEKLKEEFENDALIHSPRTLWSSAGIETIYLVKENEVYGSMAKVGSTGLLPSLNDLQMDSRLVELATDIGKYNGIQ